MEEADKTPLSLIDRLKLKAVTQKSYGGALVEQEAKLTVRNCPNCGAGRAKDEGLTICAYCDFEFLSVRLTDGITIKKENNSN
ncbi:hypothetical protein [Flavobacterium muglaense]|uniref:Uncharacterized protein n=1 Tax=Flavobacterium muglaense TaxID=2764716 RepID=A0A923MYF8_9FLAO|nr:hypothetical protein [Flavobacterium muglaense]MBC5836835.1 hypothetical protein [Flavobacterium muglaense]MBC5843364.1 hypothetical protein [Flavobacterium muglaense]